MGETLVDKPCELRGELVKWLAMQPNQSFFPDSAAEA